MFKEKDRKLLGNIESYAFKLDRDVRNGFIDVQRRLDNQKEAAAEIATLKTKVELYEKFIAKMLESDPNKSNDVFMLDGEIYRLSNYTIDAEAGEPKILTVEFKCTSDITRIFKEADDT